MLLRLRTTVALLAVASCGIARAQGAVGDTLAVPSHTPAADSSTRQNAPYERVIAGRADTVKAPFHPSRSPGLAMGLSAILPGAGQFYNGSYWKVPLVAGLGVWFISNWLDNNRRYLDNKRQYASNQDPLLSATLLRYRDFYQSERDSFAWYFLILYFANIADAYVDASLYDFNVGTDLSIRMMPVRSAFPDGSPQLQLRVLF
jgi:hypothetical protein